MIEWLSAPTKLDRAGALKNGGDFMAITKFIATAASVLILGCAGDQDSRGASDPSSVRSDDSYSHTDATMSGSQGAGSRGLGSDRSDTGSDVGSQRGAKSWGGDTGSGGLKGTGEPCPPGASGSTVGMGQPCPTPMSPGATGTGTGSQGSGDVGGAGSTTTGSDFNPGTQPGGPQGRSGTGSSQGGNSQPR
jgi:hypothetical protein